MTFTRFWPENARFLASLWRRKDCGWPQQGEKIAYGPQQGELSQPERELLFSYFNLCSEEFLFYKAGYIDQDVWKSWRKGMDVVFKLSRVSALWESESKNDSYYGFQLE